MVLNAFKRFLHVMPMRRKAQAASLLAQLFERVRVQVTGSKTMVYASCIMTRVVNLCHETSSPFVLGAESCIRFQTPLHTIQVVLQSEGLAS